MSETLTETKKKRTPEERNATLLRYRPTTVDIEASRQGGINSAIVRRKRKTLAGTAKMLMTKTLNVGAIDSAEDMMSLAEFEGKNITIEDAIVLAQIQKAICGDTQSATWVRDTIGEKPVDKVETGITIEEYVKNHKVKF